MTLYQCQRSKDRQNNQRDHSVHLGKYPWGETCGIHIDNLHQKIFLYILKHCQEKIGKEKHRQHGGKAAKEVPALLFVERHTFHAQSLVFGCRSGEPVEEIAQRGQQGQCDRTNQRRHPELTHVQRIYYKESDWLRRSAAHCNAQSEKGGEQVGHPSSFEETEDDSPHASQRQTVEEQCQYIERTGQASEKNQRELGNQNGDKNEFQAAFSLQFWNKFDPDKLGHHISEYLDDAGRYLIVHTKQFHAVECGGSERLAERIDQWIRQQCRSSRIENEK